MSCPEHGVVVSPVPWADHDARSTRAFEEQAAWLAVECSNSAVDGFMRVSWRSLGWILVSRRLLKRKDRLADRRRIGVSEISFRKGQRYLVVVVDHDRKRLIWAYRGGSGFIPHEGDGVGIPLP